MLTPSACLSWIQLIQVVVNELHACCEVSLVEFVWNVPPEGSKLASLLDCGVQEGYSIEEWLPLGKVGVVQLFLSDAGICSLQPRLHTLRGFIGELDGGLKVWNRVMCVCVYACVCDVV